MIPLPDWAPSLHPLIVHFPLALIVSAFVVDIGSSLLRGRGLATATWLYVAGTLALGAAFVSGRIGANAVMLPPQAEAIMTDHENWALRTLVFFCILAVLRVAVLQIRRLRNVVLNAFLTLMGLAGVVLLTITGDLGGSLVFGFGVGVSKAPQAEVVSAAQTSQGNQIVRRDGFYWVPGADARRRLGDEFHDFDTQLGSSLLELGSDSVLVIQATGAQVFAVTNEPFGAVQVECEVNLDHFEGEFSVVYGAEAADSYDFLKVDGESIAQGKARPNGIADIETKPATLNGWTRVGAASDGHHFRGYLDGRLVVHGHDEPSPEAGVGFRIAGQGLVLIRSVRVSPIR